MATKEELKDWFAEHPKMMGVLWMAMIAISQMGQVAASGGARAGP